MTWNNLLQMVLTVLVGAGLRWLLVQIGVEIDEELFNTIVAGIVVWLIALVGVDIARARGVRGIK